MKAFDVGNGVWQLQERYCFVLWKTIWVSNHINILDKLVELNNWGLHPEQSPVPSPAQSTNPESVPGTDRETPAA